LIDTTCPVQRGVRQHPENVALIDGGVTITYRELERMIEGQITALSASGVTAGYRIGVHAVTSIDTIVSFFALVRIGAVTCLLNVRWPEAELERVVNDLQLQVLLTQGENVTRGDNRKAPNACERGVVFFTSGTSAFPKAALLSVESLIYNAVGASERIPLDDHSRWLLSLPLYHVGGIGILYRSFLAGGAVAIPNHGEALALAIGRYDPTHLSVVHTQLWRLLRDQSLKRTTWPICLLGGGPTTHELVRTAVLKGIPLHLSYGLTEMGSQVTTSELISEPDDPMSTGSVLQYRKVQIVPSGEIVVSGKTLFKGYIDRSGIESSTDDAGWFHTGDIGEWTEKGTLRVLGRKDHQFISGGENINPESVEATLMTVAGIELAIVVPQFDPEFGQRPIAFVAEERGAILTRATVDRAKHALDQSLPRFMHPIGWYQLPGDWQSIGIKPRRRELQELLRTPDKLIPPAP
jgi:o-succinylbenzoate---CoA ligase